MATAGSLVAGKGEMVYVDMSSSVADAINVMLKKQVLSLPVLDTASGIHYTLLTMSRVVGFILNFEHGTGETVDVSRLNKLVSEMVAEEAHCTPATFATVPTTATVDQLIEIMARDQSSFNRVMVVDESGPPKLLTQTDVVAWLLEHPGHVPSAPLQDLGLCGVELHSVSAKDTALAAFRKMYRWNIAAAPIVDSEGRIVGNLSDSDMRNIDPLHFNGIMLQTVKVNVLDFLRGQHDGKVPDPVIATRSESLRDVVGRVMDAGIHRAWIVDDEQRPVGLCTLTHILERCTGVAEAA